MTPVLFLIHHDIKILLMDFSNARTTAEITQIVEEIKKTVELQRPLSLVACLDVTGTAIDGGRPR
jgi:hypothetical protein